MALYMRIGTVCYGVCMACYGVCGYGVQALGVRVYDVRCVCVVWCTLCVRVYVDTLTW